MKNVNAFINLEQFLNKNVPEELLIWGDKAIINHKYGLISMGVTNQENIRQKFNIGNKMIIFGDSGGFQLITGSNTNVSPMKTLHKYETNEVNWASIFDVPLVKISNNKLIPILDKQKTIKNAELTYKYSKVMIDKSNNLNLNIKYYNVLHGNYYDQIGKWFNIVNKLELPQFAINTRFGLKNIALKIAYLIENNIKDVFFFGTASVDNILFLLSVHKYFDNISLDTTNYSMASFSRRKVIPYIFSRNEVFYNEKEKMIGINNELIDINDFEEFCLCPICTKFNDKELWFSKIAPYLILNHNIYTFFQNLKILEFLSKFKNFQKYRIKFANNSETVENMVNFIDKTHEVGIEEAYKSYKVYFDKFESKFSGKIKYQSMDNFI